MFHPCWKMRDPSRPKCASQTGSGMFWRLIKISRLSQLRFVDTSFIYGSLNQGPRTHHSPFASRMRQVNPTDAVASIWDGDILDLAPIRSLSWNPWNRNWQKLTEILDWFVHWSTIDSWPFSIWTILNWTRRRENPVIPISCELNLPFKGELWAWACMG